MQILTFNLLSEEFGLDISCVREVLLSPEIYPLPHAPDFIEGVINLREHIITVIDLRKKLGMNLKGGNLNTRIIVCKVKKFIFGLIVDSVSEVIDIPEDKIDPAGMASLQEGAEYVYGVARFDNRVIILLKLESIVTREETEKLSVKIEKGK